jgi:BirA family transcriptional regulator, biotin operon repressor / biotin---[acetyl-CoA-carboxylase] ligase
MFPLSPLSLPGHCAAPQLPVPPWSVAAIEAAYQAGRASGGAYGGTLYDPRRDELRSLPDGAGATAPPDPDRLVIEAVDVTGSTNADLLARARAERIDRPVLRATLSQTDGRGRRGRSWRAPHGAGLWFSLAMPIGTQVPASGLTLACGVALAAEFNALRAPVRLKWPNDLLLDGRKLGGILTEVAIDPSGSTTLVIGVGLNLLTAALAAAESSAGARPEPAAPGDGGDAAAGPPPSGAAATQAPAPGAPAAAGAPGALTAVALDACLPTATVVALRDPLLGTLAAALVNAVDAVQRAGFAPWRARFDALFAYLDRPAMLVEAGLPTVTGTVRGVDDAGRLLLQTPTGMHVYLSGDLSLRPLHPLRPFAA